MAMPPGGFPTLLHPSGGTTSHFEPMRLSSPGILQLSEILSSLRSHALFVWVALPLLAILQFLVPALRPTCDAGFSDLALAAALLAIVAHHSLMEAKAWAASKTFATAPELIVLRTYGVLAKRRWLVLIGLVEALSIYNDLTFPLVAYECRANLTERWAESWMAFPGFGHAIVGILRTVRFWGAAQLCVLVMLVTSLPSLVRLLSTTAAGFLDGALLSTRTMPSARPGETDSWDEEPRISGDALVTLARHAETACTPSVARFCSELALQRRWVYDAKESLGGALGKARNRESVIFGRAKPESMDMHELRDEETSQKIDSAGKMHACGVLSGKVLIGSILPLWIQAEYFELAFNQLGPEARLKLAIRVAISGVYLVGRMRALPFKPGPLATSVALLGFATVAWAALKIVNGFLCPEHMWEVFGGCVAHFDNSGGADSPHVLT